MKTTSYPISAWDGSSLLRRAAMGLLLRRVWARQTVAPRPQAAAGFGATSEQFRRGGELLLLQRMGALSVAWECSLFALGGQTGRYSLVAVNNERQTTRTIPFWFPIAGHYREELHGGALNLSGIIALQEVSLDVPLNYGRIWTTS